MTDEEHQILRWHLNSAQRADHMAMGERYRVCSKPIPGVDGRGFDTKPEARLWLAAKRRNLVRLVEMAAERGWHFETWALAEALWAYFTGNGNYEDAERCYRLAAAAAEADGNPVAQMRMLLLLAQTLTDARSFTEAAEVLATVRSATADGVGDPDPDIARHMLILVGTTLEFTGRLHLKREQVAQAQDWFEQALGNAYEQDRRAERGNPRVIALQLWFLARCHWKRGEMEIAVAEFEEARHLFRLARDSRTGLMLRIEESLFALERGEIGANQQVQDALTLAEEDAITLPAAEGWHQLAVHSEGPRRREYLRRAEALYRSIRDPAVDEVRKLLDEP